MSSESNHAGEPHSERPPRTDGLDHTNETDARFGRLHPASVFFDVVSHLKAVIVPAVVAIYSAALGNTWGLILGGLLVVPSLIVSLFKYFSLRFRIHDGELVVTEGILFRRIRTVPVRRIQNINLVQNPLHRLIRVAEVRVETASGTEPEAILRVLPMAHVHALRDAIFETQASTTAQQAGVSMAASDAPQTGAAESELLRIPTTWLCQAGLANNRGMILIGLLAGAVYQFDLDDRFDFDRLTGFVQAHASESAVPFIVIGGILAMLLLLRLLSIAWYLLRFHNYRLARAGDDLRITCGLFTKISASIPRRRVQFISIQQNLWMKWMHISSIRIETAGGSGKETEAAAGSVSSRWFIPVITDDKVAGIVNQLREGLEWREAELDWRPLSPRTARRLTRLAIFKSICIGLFGLAFTRPWGMLLGLAASVPLVWYANKISRAMKYARTDDGVVYRSGLLTRKVSMTFFDRIQTLRVGQSPFDRRWSMAQLSVDTAAAGPAEHTIRIPYLPEDFAEHEYREILQRVSES